MRGHQHHYSRFYSAVSASSHFQTSDDKTSDYGPLKTPGLPPPWLFGLTNIPFGVAGGYTSVAMPFLLREAGVPVASIAAVSASVLIPLSYQFLWAPVLDIRLRRRSWLLLMSALGALMLGASLFLTLPAHLFLFEIFCIAGQGFTGMVSSCNGALIATQVPSGFHGRASGWLNAANLGGNALGGGLVLGAARLFSPQIAGILLGLITLLPAFAVLLVPEARKPKQQAAQVFSSMLREVWKTVSARRGWTGILFCIAPVSTPALLDLFSAIGDDYHAPARTVEYTMGYASGLMTMLGALLGGRMLDYIDKRRAYLLSGLAIAGVDIGMAFAPLTPNGYIAGTIAYSLVAGFCFAAFSAVVLEIIGKVDGAAATQYTLFDAAGNLATSYLAWMDGLGYEYFRSHHHAASSGMLLTDAAMNVAGAAALALMMLWVFAKRPRIAA